MSSEMPAARIHGPGDVRLDTLSRPAIGPGDVLVAVMQCGICGSDLSYSKIGGLPGAASPFALGHEFAGVVAEVGPEVEGLSCGDRVVINPEGAGNGIGSDGHAGAFAPFLLFQRVNDDPLAIQRLPSNLDFEQGALVEPLAVGMNAVERGAIGEADRVAIYGAGPVGLSAGIAARQAGADVVIADLSERRLEAAEELGLTPMPPAVDASEFLRARHGTARDQRLGDLPGTDVYIEATGVGSVFQQILSTARRRATVVVVGVQFAPVELDMINLMLRELTITASQAYDNGVFERVIAMLESGAVDTAPLISHRFPLHQFNEAFAQAADGQAAIKVMVNCEQWQDEDLDHQLDAGGPSGHA